MYVCVCNAVTERDIQQAVKEGARTVKHLKDKLGVATECTACVDCAKACLKEAHHAHMHAHHDARVVSLMPRLERVA